jgi:hypothetical protein
MHLIPFAGGFGIRTFQTGRDPPECSANGRHNPAWAGRRPGTAAFSAHDLVRKTVEEVGMEGSVSRPKVNREPLRVIDMQDWLARLFSGEAPPRLKVRLGKLAQIITYATAKDAGISVDFQPGCWKRPNRTTCRGVLGIKWVLATDQIHWRCPACGNRGAVSGWRGEYWDMTSSFAGPE